MSPGTVMKVVLDTNVVLDWLHFSDSGCLTLAKAIQSGQIEPITSGLCLEELRQVIKKPQFKLDIQAQEQLVQKYQAYARVLNAGEPLVNTLPCCSDPDDQKFIELAWTCGAQYLLSRDKAVLKLSRRLQQFGFQVLSPENFSTTFNLPRPDGPPPSRATNG
jgi:putative PIN family toxin of toxin-antitoxin system